MKPRLRRPVLLAAALPLAAWLTFLVLDRLFPFRRLFLLWAGRGWDQPASCAL